MTEMNSRLPRCLPTLVGVTVSYLVVASGCGGKVMGNADGETGQASASGATPSAAGHGAATKTVPKGGSISVIGSGGVGQGGSSSIGAQMLPITQEQYQSIVQSACSGFSVESEPAVFGLTWLIDVSSSMQEVATGDTLRKWDRTLLALDEAMQAIDLHAQETCSFTRSRLLAFPGMQTDDTSTSQPRPVEACVQTSAMLRSDLDGAPSRWEMMAALRGIVPRGGTPVLDAYDYARQWQDPVASPKYMVLVTDGMPTIDVGCKVLASNPSSIGEWPIKSLDDRVAAPVESIIAEIAAARAEGILTFVAGTAGSEPARSWLSRAAVAGGTARANCNPHGSEPYCHMDLVARPLAMSEMASAMFALNWHSCTYATSAWSSLGSNAVDEDRILPIVTDARGQRWLIPRYDGRPENCIEGFRRIGEDAIELCPVACTLLNSGCQNTVEVYSGCKADSTFPDLL